MRLLAKAPELVPLFGFVGFASVYAMLHACRKTRQALQKQHDVLPYIKYSYIKYLGFVFTLDESCDDLIK